MSFPTAVLFNRSGTNGSRYKGIAVLREKQLQLKEQGDASTVFLVSDRNEAVSGVLKLLLWTELEAEFPEQSPERLNRTLLNLGRLQSEPGQPVCDPHAINDYFQPVTFARNNEGMFWTLEQLALAGYIDYEKGKVSAPVIKAEGWERIDQLKEGHQNTRGIARPVIFVSYAGEELALAGFVRDVLLRWTDSKIDVFVAKRDIPPGKNPLTVMMEEKLKSAVGIVPICSIQSKGASWLWWETASVWARGHKIYPLFTNIAPNVFGGPLILVSQGRAYFVKEEFIEALKEVCGQLAITIPSAGLSTEEAAYYEKLKEQHSSPQTSAQISVTHQKLDAKDQWREWAATYELREVYAGTWLYFPKSGGPSVCPRCFEEHHRAITLQHPANRAHAQCPSCAVTYQVAKIRLPRFGSVES